MKEKIIKTTIIIALFVIFVTKINIDNETLSGPILANLEALAQTEGSGEYNVMHFDCFDTEGQKTGKCTGASFKGPNGSRPQHVHNCSWCCE